MEKLNADNFKDYKHPLIKGIPLGNLWSDIANAEAKAIPKTEITLSRIIAAKKKDIKFAYLRCLLGNCFYVG